MLKNTLSIINVPLPHGGKTTEREEKLLSILNAAFLGFIQGVAEFLPISSSGHLAVLQNIFRMQTAEEGHMLCCCILAR